jgi:tetratricopeptide (TPR) repeat protein
MDSPSQYFPLTYTTFRFEHLLFGLNPAGYHWFNLLLHSVNALLVWRLLWRLKIPGAFLAACIFALHPVQVESVAWITELKNVQMLFFFLLALLAWVEFLEEKPEASWRLYLFALLACALALCSKTTACTLPAALVLILWLKGKPLSSKRLAQVVPFLALGFAMGMLTIWWERYHQGTQGKLFGLGLLERVLVASRAIWFYVCKLFWPANLTFIYPRWTVDPSYFWGYVWLGAATGSCGLIYWARKRLGRGPETAAVFYVATLSPTLGFIMLYTFRFSFVADHYQYVASIGPIALASAAVSLLLLRSKPSAPVLQTIICFAFILMLGTLTRRQAGMYKDDETLWKATLARNPTCFLAYDNLGEISFRKGQIEEAITYYKNALDINPDFSEAYNNLGNAFLQKRQLDQAIANYQKAKKISPDHAAPYYNLANAKLQQGRTNEAFAEYEQALQVLPRHPGVHYNFGNLLIQSGRVDDAIAQYQRALEINRRYPEVRNNLAAALFLKGRVDEAIAQYGKELENNPDNAGAHYNLANILLQAGKADQAIIEYQQALQINPEDAGARHNLAKALMQQGRSEEAIIHFEQVLRVEPGSVKAHYNLALAYLQTGRREEARREVKEVLKLKPDFVLPKDVARLLEEKSK